MQHYQFHIGDYIKDTAHLTDAEDLAYRRLLDLYYTLEGPLPIDVKPLCRRARIAQDVAEQILSEFFIKTADGFHHSRCDQELERIYAKSEKARASAKFSVEVRKSNYAKRAERLYDAKAKGTHTSIEWEALKDACGSKCVKCGADEPLTKDHIQPIYQGGSDGLDNIQPLCKSCNSAKGPENIDYRPRGWVAFVERTLSERSANVMLPITRNPLPITQESEALSGKPDEAHINGKKKLSESCLEVLTFLNEKTGRNYQPVKANINLIAGRLREGATVDQCRQVIAKKCREWRDDPSQEIYLRPKTLFNATNFANYQGELVP